jgi:integrase
MTCASASSSGEFPGRARQCCRLGRRGRVEPRRRLAPKEIQELFGAYDLPLSVERSIRTPDEAAAAAQALGFPVVLKAVGPGLVHKTDVGGIALDLSDADSVSHAAQEMVQRLARAGYGSIEFLVQPLIQNGVEMIAGFVHDPVFGPVVACGSGGVVVELVRDVSLRIAPLDRDDATEMIRDLKMFPLLEDSDDPGHRRRERKRRPRSCPRRRRRRTRSRRRSRDEQPLAGHPSGLRGRLGRLHRVVPGAELHALAGRTGGPRDVSAARSQDAQGGLDWPAHRSHRALPRAGRPDQPNGAPDGQERLEGRAPRDRHRAEGQVGADHRWAAAGRRRLRRRRIDVRDRALLLLGFAAALRRSEIVALDVADVAFVAEGAAVTIRHSKTDQEGAGVLLGVPFGSNPETCAVRALQAWIALLDDAAPGAPLFVSLNRHSQAGDRLSASAVAEIVKRRCAAVDLAGDFSGHSMRAGFVTTAAGAGVDALEISNQTRHKSLDMVKRYSRPATIWKSNAAFRVGM